MSRRNEFSDNKGFIAGVVAYFVFRLFNVSMSESMIIALVVTILFEEGERLLL